MATAPFSKTPRSCALLSSWRHDGQDRRDKQTTKFTTPPVRRHRRKIRRETALLCLQKITAFRGNKFGKWHLYLLHLYFINNFSKSKRIQIFFGLIIRHALRRFLLGLGKHAVKLLEIVSCDKYLARNIALGVCWDYYIIYPKYVHIVRHLHVEGEGKSYYTCLQLLALFYPKCWYNVRKVNQDNYRMFLVSCSAFLLRFQSFETDIISFNSWNQWWNVSKSCGVQY